MGCKNLSYYEEGCTNEKSDFFSWGIYKKGVTASKKRYNYYPYGKILRSYSNGEVDRYLSTQHERDKETGYDYRGARFYDSDIARFLSLDPSAADYPNLTPYSYVAGNPVIAIDPDGKDIVVLSYGKGRAGHYLGHQALLISNDKGGYTFYSKDKDSDGENNDRYTIETFESIEDFANSEYNTFKSDYDDGQGTETSHKDSEGNVMQRFTRGYLIETTEKQDKAAGSAAGKETVKPFNIFNSNCTHSCREGLDAADLENGEESKGGSSNYHPESKQDAIEEKNKGTDVSDILKSK